MRRNLSELEAARRDIGTVGALDFLIEKEGSCGKDLRHKRGARSDGNENVGLNNQVVVRELHPAASGWTDWRLAPDVEIEPFDNLMIKAGKGRVIASINRLSLEPGEFYRIRYSLSATNPNLSPYFTMVPSGSTGKGAYFGGNLIPVPVSDESSSRCVHEFYFRMPWRTSDVEMALAVKSVGEATVLSIQDISISKVVDPEEELKPEIPKGESIIASLSSIPSRQSFLPELVASLEYQVDEIRIFLNDHAEIPEALRSHPKVSVETSDVFGDQGDIGKFHWVEDTTPGYRLTCDDDIVYPPDYVKTLVSELQAMGDQGVVGVHGALLRQPIDDYYGQTQRKVYHFRNGLADSEYCHVLGTGTVAYKSGAIALDGSTFQCRNMADIWFAKAANQQQVPLKRIASPHNWLKERESSQASIYTASSRQTGCRSDTRALQSHALKSGLRLTLPPAGVASRKKVVMGIKTYNRVDYLKDCIDSFIRTRDQGYNWVLIVADDGSEDGTLEYLDSLVLPVEFHVIKNRRRYAVGQTNTILDLAMGIGFDFGFNIDDDLVFTKPGWDSLYIEAVKNSGYTHLVHRHLKHAENLLKNKDSDARLPSPVYDSSLACIAHGDSYFDLGTGSLVTFTMDTVDRVGYCDERNFPIRGQWHVDYHIRCARAGCNDSNYLFDAIGSNEFLEIQNYLSEDYRCAIPWGEEYKKTKDPAELERRFKVMEDESRVFVPRPIGSSTKPKTPNDVIDHAYVLNLDRRPDRWRGLLAGAERVGLSVDRFPAVDGSKEPYRSQYEEYASQPLIDFPDGYEVRSSYQVYRGDAPHAARVAFFEQKLGRKAIGSLGAWGYLNTMIAILEDALEKGYENILVLDDDAKFHKRFNDLFMRHYEQLPLDWKLWQLGALQYHWEDDWISWHSDGLYRCHGSSVGSHAVVMNRAIIPMVLDECRRLDLPYDEGPLHKPKAIFPDQCVTSYPNLVIQDVAESDISSETEQLSGGETVLKQYGWDLSEYLD